MQQDKDTTVVKQDATVGQYIREDLPSNVTGMTAVQRLEANIKAASIANEPLVEQREQRLALAKIKVVEIAKMQEGAAKAIAKGGTKGGGGKQLKQAPMPKPLTPLPKPQLLQETNAAGDALTDELMGYMFVDTDAEDEPKVKPRK